VVLKITKTQLSDNANQLCHLKHASQLFIH